jgi:hypothetical protein
MDIGVAALKEGAKRSWARRLEDRRSLAKAPYDILFTMTTTVNGKARRTAMVPVTTMEEAPILSEEERSELIASLKAAEDRIAAGHYVEHDPDTFVDRLLEIRAEAIRNKKA